MEGPFSGDRTRGTAPPQSRIDAGSKEMIVSSKKIARRTANVALAAGGAGAIGVGLGMVTGFLDFSNFPDSLLPRDRSGEITTADTATDGREGKSLDLQGRVVEPESEDEYVTTDQIERMEITGPEEMNQEAFGSQAGSSSGRMRIDEVGMDVPINVMSTVDGVITPPGFRSVYVVRDQGTGMSDPSQGRLVVAVHSAVRRFPPGNYLIDTSSGEPQVHPGTMIDFSGAAYRITGHEQIAKSELPKAEHVWSDDPGTMSIITCRQVGGPRTTHNTVIFAEFQGSV